VNNREPLQKTIITLCDEQVILELLRFTLTYICYSDSAVPSLNKKATRLGGLQYRPGAVDNHHEMVAHQEAPNNDNSRFTIWHYLIMNLPLRISTFSLDDFNVTASPVVLFFIVQGKLLHVELCVVLLLILVCTVPPDDCFFSRS
jgi:hypothetical protein